MDHHSQRSPPPPPPPPPQHMSLSTTTQPPNGRNSGSDIMAAVDRCHDDSNSPIKLTAPCAPHSNGGSDISNHNLGATSFSAAAAASANNLAVNLKMRTVTASPPPNSENGISSTYLPAADKTLSPPSMDRREFDFSKINGEQHFRFYFIQYPYNWTFLKTHRI